MGRPEPISAVIARMMPGMEKPRETAQAVLLRAWPDIVSLRAAAHAEPVSIANATLVVCVDHSCWAHELTMRKAEILSRIKKIIPDCPINAVRFKVAAKARGKRDGAPQE